MRWSRWSQVLLGLALGCLWGCSDDTSLTGRGELFTFTVVNVGHDVSPESASSVALGTTIELVVAEPETEEVTWHVSLPGDEDPDDPCADGRDAGGVAFVEPVGNRVRLTAEALGKVRLKATAALSSGFFAEVQVDCVDLEIHAVATRSLASQGVAASEDYYDGPFGSSEPSVDMIEGSSERFVIARFNSAGRRLVGRGHDPTEIERVEFVVENPSLDGCVSADGTPCVAHSLGEHADEIVITYTDTRPYEIHVPWPERDTSDTVVFRRSIVPATDLDLSLLNLDNQDETCVEPGEKVGLTLNPVNRLDGTIPLGLEGLLEVEVGAECAVEVGYLWHIATLQVHRPGGQCGACLVRAVLAVPGAIPVEHLVQFKDCSSTDLLAGCEQ